MTETEVKKQIKQYGESTNIIFGDFVFAFSMMNECDEISADFIATLSYNCTINIIDRILNNLISICAKSFYRYYLSL